MRLPRTRRLLQGSEFRSVRSSGQSAAGRFLVLGFLEGHVAEDYRFGFITTKRLGNAVVRNQVRRRLRAIVRSSGQELRAGQGGRVVTVARYNASRATYRELAEDWAGLASKLGIILASSREEEQ